MSEELRPCPFCNTDEFGVIPEQDFHQYENRDLWLATLQCHSHPYFKVFGGGKSKSEAFETAKEKWNTRPIEDALRAEISSKDAEIAALERVNNAWREWDNNRDAAVNERSPFFAELQTARARLAEVKGENK